MKHVEYNTVTAEALEEGYIKVSYLGNTSTVDPEHSGSTYLGAIAYVGIDLPKGYNVELLPTSCRIMWH